MGRSGNRFPAGATPSDPSADLSEVVRLTSSEPLLIVRGGEIFIVEVRLRVVGPEETVFFDCCLVVPSGAVTVSEVSSTLPVVVTLPWNANVPGDSGSGERSIFIPVAEISAEGPADRLDLCGFESIVIATVTPEMEIIMLIETRSG